MNNKKYLILTIIAIIFLASCSAKYTKEMYVAKQVTEQAAKVEEAQMRMAAYSACGKDSNPGLCIAAFNLAMGQASKDTNAVPQLTNGWLEMGKAVVKAGTTAYLGNVAGDVITSGYNAIRGTANDVSVNTAGANSSINVQGTYIADNSGRVNSDDNIDNSIDNTDNSVNNIDNSVDNSNHDNDNSDNSNHDNDNSNHDNDNRHDYTPILPPDDGGGV